MVTFDGTLSVAVDGIESCSLQKTNKHCKFSLFQTLANGNHSEKKLLDKRKNRRSRIAGNLIFVTHFS